MAGPTAFQDSPVAFQLDPLAWQIDVASVTGGAFDCDGFQHDAFQTDCTPAGNIDYRLRYRQPEDVRFGRESRVPQGRFTVDR